MSRSAIYKMSSHKEEEVQEGGWEKISENRLRGAIRAASRRGNTVGLLSRTAERTNVLEVSVQGLSTRVYVRRPRDRDLRAEVFVR